MQRLDLSLLSAALPQRLALSEQLPRSVQETFLDAFVLLHFAFSDEKIEEERQKSKGICVALVYFFERQRNCVLSAGKALLMGRGELSLDDDAPSLFRTQGPRAFPIMFASERDVLVSSVSFSVSVLFPHSWK